MQRLLVVFGLSLAILIQAGNARADWHTTKMKWDAFWHRVHVDWHRNNAWPEPFVSVDRQAVRAPLTAMADRGWQLQNTIPNELFNAETQELTRAGELKVRWTLTQMPTRRRTLFVLRGRTPEITDMRLKSVEKAAAAVTGDASSAMIAVTDIVPRGGSGDYYERVNRGYESSVPPPRLPDMESSDGGS